MSPAEEFVRRVRQEREQVLASMAAEEPYPDGKRILVASNEKGRRHVQFSLMLTKQACGAYDVFLEERKKNFKQSWDAAASVLSDKPLAASVEPDSIKQTVTNLIQELRRDSVARFGIHIPRLVGSMA